MKDKLELNWAGKRDGYALIRDEATGKPVQVPYDEVQPRLLVEAGVYGDVRTDNILISGENLYALKTLVKSGYAGKVKCIYIDPPYNTGNAFAHYDDALEHSLWLDMMSDRIELLKDLLADDGSLWISIDDDEMPYLRVMLDEILGRSSFVACNVWQKRYSRENREAIGDVHEYVLTYAKSAELFKRVRNKVPLNETQAKVYKNRNGDPDGRWRAIPMTAQGYRQNQMYPITAPAGAIHYPPEGRCWGMIESEFNKLREQGRIYFGKDNNSQPGVIRYLSEVDGLVPWTWWQHEEVGHTDEAKKEMHALFGKTDAFDTPKPERLMKRIIEIATNPGDIVLDCFAGSGTTGAVALKMNRRFVMVQVGGLCETHIAPRLRQVIDGTDKGGISPLVPLHPSRAESDADLLGETKPQLGWTGGGGFRFYTLGKSLMDRDAETGVWRLNYTNGRMIEAVCLQEGYKLIADGWRHGVRGRHFAHVAESLVTQELIDRFAAELAEDESLTIYCTKAKRALRKPDNLDIKRIPRDLVPKTSATATADGDGAAAQ